MVIKTGKRDIPEFTVSTYAGFDPGVHKGPFFTKLKFSGLLLIGLICFIWNFGLIFISEG